MPARRAVSGLIVAAALAGCSGEPPLLGVAVPASSETVAASAEPGTTADNPAGFNPFSEQPASAVGAREVIANPTVADIMQTNELPEISLGRADAPVVIVQYASLTCPHCRKFQLETLPVLKKEYIDTGKVRYVLRAEFPIGKQSGLATIALRCAPPGKYFELYGKFMTQQASWVSQEVRSEPILKVAAQVGMTQAQFDSCRQNRGMIAQLNWVKERGRKLGIIGTPNFFVNGKLVKTVIGIKEIREMVDPVLAGRVAATDGKAKAR